MPCRSRAALRFVWASEGSGSVTVARAATLPSRMCRLFTLVEFLLEHLASSQLDRD